MCGTTELFKVSRDGMTRYWWLRTSDVKIYDFLWQFSTFYAPPAGYWTKLPSIVYQSKLLKKKWTCQIAPGGRVLQKMAKISDLLPGASPLHVSHT